MDRKPDGIEDIDKWYYNELNDILYSNTLGNGGNIVYNNGVWAEIVSESLEQQLQKAEAEVKRLQSLIEEYNKPKIGDWVYNIYKKSFYKIGFRPLTTESEINQCKKITNQKLIKLLEQEIK